MKDGGEMQRRKQGISFGSGEKEAAKPPCLLSVLDSSGRLQAGGLEHTYYKLDAVYLLPTLSKVNISLKVQI
jgi:hypothetical protein